MKRCEIKRSNQGKEVFLTKVLSGAKQRFRLKIEEAQEEEPEWAVHIVFAVELWRDIHGEHFGTVDSKHLLRLGS
jgi:16S rRNA U1498 N3-methylase RsmE